MQIHNEILSKNQLELLPLIKNFYSNFWLAGGTAVALHLGHRRSIDFDLFTNLDFDQEKVRSIIRSQYNIQSTLVQNLEELTVAVRDVKLTFCKYPYNISHSEQLGDIIKMPDILTLAAMKAFALGRRAKWKDYVDTFFVLKTHTLQDITIKSKEIFGDEFNERLYREQLAYFDDVDYSEKIDYISGYEVSDSEVKQLLMDVSLK